MTEATEHAGVEAQEATVVAGEDLSAVRELAAGGSVAELVASVEPARAAYRRIADSVRGQGSGVSGWPRRCAPFAAGAASKRSDRRASARTASGCWTGCRRPGHTCSQGAQRPMPLPTPRPTLPLATPATP